MFQFFAETKYEDIEEIIEDLSHNFVNTLFDMTRSDKVKASIESNLTTLLQKAREYLFGYFIGLLLYTCKKISKNFSPSFSEYGIEDMLNLFTINTSANRIDDINRKISPFNTYLLNMVKEICDFSDDWACADYCEVGGSLIRRLLTDTF